MESSSWPHSDLADAWLQTVIPDFETKLVIDDTQFAQVFTYVVL